MENEKILKDYLRKCKAEGTKPDTIETFNYILKRFIKWRGEHDLYALTPDG